MTDIDYIGNELELFRHAHNWKAYYRGVIDPYIKGEVCEVGAGLGGTTTALLNDAAATWLAVEPDRELSSQIEHELSGHPQAQKVSVLHGTLDDVGTGRFFDTILYIDVIEHIEHDKAEFEKAARRLRPGGHLIILVPAFNFLYNAFDKSIGHYRRYNKSMLRAIARDSDLDNIRLDYFDSMGFFASTVNKLFLHKSIPSIENIRMWDGTLVPVSRIVDPLILRSFGKSLIGIWQKPDHKF